MAQYLAEFRDDATGVHMFYFTAVDAKSLKRRDVRASYVKVNAKARDMAKRKGVPGKLHSVRCVG